MSTRRGAAMAAAGALLCAAGVAGGLWTSGAGAVPDYGPYTLAATAPGVEISEDQPSANAHPEGAAMFPYTTVALTNGPLGYALASIAWPGATEANGGALVSLLFPTEIRPPVPGAPVVPIPDAIHQLAMDAAPLADYPIRAEARSGSQPDATYDQIEGTTLTAHADNVLAQATGQVDGAEQTGVAKYGSMTSITNAALGDTVSEATAYSRITDIEVVGGVIKIDSITSTARTTTDGASATAEGSTLVQGMTIAGQPAYLDETGLHIGEQNQPANAVINDLAKQALTDAGVFVYVSQPHSEVEGASASYDAGSVIILWIPPGNPAGNVFTIAFGGARASGVAGPGFGVNSPTTTPTVGAGPAPTVGSGSSGSTGSPIAPGAGPATTTPTTSGGSGPSIVSEPIRAIFGGIPGGWVAAALAGVGLMAAGTKRAADDIVFRTASACPLETT